MRTSLTPVEEDGDRPRGRLLPLPAAPLPMTRCECADVSFDEIERLLGAGEPLPAALARTGCAGTCTACRPDLESFLAARYRPD